MQLREKNKRVPKPSNFSWQEYDYIPTGILILALKISWQNIECKDDKQPLEKQLSKMIAKLEAKAIEEKEKHLRWEKERIIREEQYQIKKAKEEEMKKELEKFILLKKNAEAWHIAAQIRGYLKDLELKAIEQQNMNEELLNWLNWAYKKLEWYDPNISAKDDLIAVKSLKIHFSSSIKMLLSLLNNDRRFEICNALSARRGFILKPLFFFVY